LPMDRVDRSRMADFDSGKAEARVWRHKADAAIVPRRGIDRRSANGQRRGKRLDILAPAIATNGLPVVTVHKVGPGCIHLLKHRRVGFKRVAVILLAINTGPGTPLSQPLIQPPVWYP